MSLSCLIKLLAFYIKCFAIEYDEKVTDKMYMLPANYMLPLTIFNKKQIRIQMTLSKFYSFLCLKP